MYFDSLRLLLVLTLLPAALLAESSGLIASGAQVEKAAGGFQFTEGPAADQAGNVFFSDIRQTTIFKWSLDGKVTVFRDKLPGCNGLMFDAQGQLIVCQTGAGRALAALALDGTETILVTAFEGKRLNSPNDLWIDARGGIYFSDPRYGNRDNMELPGEYVFYLSPDRAKLTAVATDLRRPNGVIGSRDGKVLYIADPADKKTWAYDIQPDGSLAHQRLFAPGSADGMGVDQHGNIYLVTTTVEIWSPAGVLLEKISVPEKPTNVTWGGADRKTLFITAQTGLYTLRMNVTGY
jgi:gluconolactonase